MKCLVPTIGVLTMMGCCAHRDLETRVHGRGAESLQAVALRAPGGWDVTLPLPTGSWKTEGGEDTPVRVVEVPGGREARWTVGPERWARTRPFHLRRLGEKGTALDLEIRYGALPVVPRIVLEVAHTLASGKALFPR